MMNFSDKKLTGFLLFVAVAINFSGLFLPIIGPDGSLYAAIAKKMAINNNYTELFGNGTDWLDKPHFPFWITALFFEIFGINYWSYKLPAILFMLIGARYTWLFAKDLYNSTIADWSAIILLTAQHIILSNTDVRAEPYLTGLIIASTFHYYKAYTKKNFLQLFIGSFFAACAVMTKGMFALIPIGAAIGGHLLIKKEWTEIFQWRWIIAAILVMIMIIPELYTLYYQFDSHPEKVVFGKTNVSGIRFFFWDSQFGRFFNTGPITGKGDPSFFLHTTLWAFLPWSLMLYAAIFQLIRKGITKQQVIEWYTLCGSLATFLLFSLSKFQLPHYLNIVFPFFAIITAQYLFYLQRHRPVNLLRIIQNSITGILLLLGAALYVFFNPPGNHIVILFLIFICITLMLFLPKMIKTGIKEIIIARSVLAIVAVNLFMNLIFYPELLKYQGGTTAAHYINKNLPGIPVVQLQPRFSYTLEFDLNDTLITIPSLKDTAGLNKPYILFIQKDDDPSPGKPIAEFPLFHISRLNGRFIDQRQRQSQLQYFRVYKIE